MNQIMQRCVLVIEFTESSSEDLGTTSHNVAWCIKWAEDTFGKENCAYYKTYHGDVALAIILNHDQANEVFTKDPLSDIWLEVLIGTEFFEFDYFLIDRDSSTYRLVATLGTPIAMIHVGYCARTYKNRPTWTHLFIKDIKFEVHE